MEGKLKDEIIEELSVYKDTTKDDNKRMATTKDEVKELIARSPDASDCWLQRMYFEIKGKMTPNQSPDGSLAINKQKEMFDINEENNSTKINSNK